MRHSNKRIAYLNSDYWGLSHTFIHREVEELIKLGLEIDLFSVRKSQPPNLRNSKEDCTFYILSSFREVLLDTLFHTLFNPVSVARALIFSQRISPPGIKQRILHSVYVMEAVRLVKELRKRNLRHVHVHMANNAASISLIATQLFPSLTYSLSIHGPAEFLNVETTKLKEKVENALFVRCISEFCRSQIMSVIKMEYWNKLYVIHCGVTKSTVFPASQSQIRNKFIFVGRLVPEKGPVLLIKALEIVNEIYQDWKLVIIGTGPLENDLKELVNKKNLSEMVRFSGALSPLEVQQEINKNDVLILPSFMEGIPVVLMEAMSQGKLVITTKIAGIPELIEDKKSGLLLPPGNVGALAQAIKNILAGNESYEKILLCGKYKVETEFNSKLEAEKMFLLFNSYEVISITLRKSA